MHKTDASASLQFAVLDFGLAVRADKWRREWGAGCSDLRWLFRQLFSGFAGMSWQLPLPPRFSARA